MYNVCVCVYIIPAYLLDVFTYYMYIPALRVTFSTVPCTSLVGGISFHVARKTLRSEGGREEGGREEREVVRGRKIGKRGKREGGAKGRDRSVTGRER